MKLSSHKILKYVTENKEVSLLELMPFIGNRFRDYRDYYLLAQLCSAGYVGHGIRNQHGKESDVKLLASMFYSFATGVKKVNNYTSNQDKPTAEHHKFYSTIKAELYFAELNAKRSDRIYAIAIGIIVGICTAILTIKLNVK